MSARVQMNCTKGQGLTGNELATAEREFQQGYLKHHGKEKNVGDIWHGYVAAWMYPAYQNEYNHDKN
jgi:hypothetical protein